MNYYFLFLILFFIISLIFIKVYGFDNIKQNKKYLIVIFVCLMLFSMLKSNDTAIDSYNYQRIFEDISNTSFLDVYSFGRYEIGYKYFCKIISLIWKNYTFFSAIVTIITLSGFYYFIKNYSNNYVYSLFIFITYDTYIFTFGILRQAIALSILLFSIKYIKENKFVKFMLLVLLASTFHKTALLFIVCYFLKKIPLNKKMMIVYSLLSLIILIFGETIINLILSYIYRPANATFYSGSGYKLLLLLYLCSIVTYIYRNKLEKQNKFNVTLIKIIMYATLIQSLAPTFYNVGRMTIYFFPVLNILITNLLEIIKDKKLIILMVVSLTIYYYFRTCDLIYAFFFM